MLAPAITGIPELVTAGKTGFLYKPGSLDDFVEQLLFIRSLIWDSSGSVLDRPKNDCDNRLEWIRHAARVQVRQNFNRVKNLELFSEMFLERVTPQSESVPNENLILQQI